jgi:integrase
MARGSVYKRGSTWTAHFDLGKDPVTSKRKQQTKGGFPTRREASKWLTEQQGRLDKGEFIKPSKLTYGAYLLEHWLPAVRSSKRRPSTVESYERITRRHVVPKLGHIPLQQLSGADLDRAYREMQTSGRLDGSGGLSGRSVAYIATIIHRSLMDAMTWGMVTRNVAEAVVNRPDSKPSREMSYWTAEQLRTFLDQLSGDRLYPVVLLLATTGLRRGEALALRWSDVDLDAGRLSVRRTLGAVRDVDSGAHVPIFTEPKTAKGRRSVPLPAQTVAVLRAWRKTQAQERLMAGPGWQDNGLTFTEPDGSPYHPDQFRKRFETRVARSGLPYLRVHDLRHTYATLALQANKPVKVVSEILGHASVSITYDTYSHVIPSMMEDAADTVAALIFGQSALANG